jgi:putative membrane protein
VPSGRRTAHRSKPPAISAAHERYRRILFFALLAFAAALGIAPHDRAAWLLENGLTILGLAVLVVTRDTLPLSRISYTMIFALLCLHSIGSHYTYSEVPYARWIAAVFGENAAPTGRNQYDRMVHFAYGLLLAYPIREVLRRVADARGFWGYYLPLDVTMASSMLYELIEWGAAVAFGGDLGVAYLGSQGDAWDAQKDMALATLGACIAMLVTAALNARYQRDFAREWAESLRVKRAEPLGEDELRRRIRESERSS